MDKQPAIGFEKTIRMSTFGSVVNVKNILIMLAVLLGGGGGVAAFDFATKSDVEVRIEEKILNASLKEDMRHQRIDGVMQQQGAALRGIKSQVGDIQTVQLMTIARDEARRLTINIKNRANRERTYDRLRELNLKRLQSGRGPCLIISCND